MTKIYTMKIRDLTNEAKELNAQTIQVKSFEQEVKKQISIMAENHISAIASYLNHQLDEIAKFTNRFYAGIYLMEERIDIKIEKRGSDVVYILNIKPSGWSTSTGFIVNNPNSICCEMFLSEINKKTPYHAETLIRNWNKFKKQLQYNIKVKIDEIQKGNEEKQKALQAKLSLYENFEL